MTREGWSSADLHIHSTASDGTATPLEVLRWANERTDLAVIAIADHNAVDGALEACDAAARMGRVQVVVAQEVESAEGHIVGLWAPERVVPGMMAMETVAAIHEQGGLAIAPHPFAPRWWHKHGLCRAERCVYDETPFDGIEVANSTPMLLHANPRARWYWWWNRHRLARTGGSDAHILSVIGSSRTLFRGRSAEDLRHAIESRETRVYGPRFSALRPVLYARHVPAIRRSRKAYQKAENDAYRDREAG
ncbi:MAG: phosphotransferase [Coriobacteriaceae bacterium]|nr:phosphotransferase [Coriobacteriaceae bacterium]